MAEAIDVREEVPSEEKEVEEEEEEDGSWDSFDIYMPTTPGAIETPGETFGSPMTKGEETIVTRDERRVKGRILFSVLKGYSPDAGTTSKAFLDMSEVRVNDKGRVLGIRFAGMDVIVTKRGGKGYRETTNQTVRSSEGFEQYEERVKTMKEEFRRNTSPGVTRDIISDVASIESPEWDTVGTVEARCREEAHVATEELKRNLEDSFEEETFSKQEKRELGGLLQVTQNRVSENPIENKQAQIDSFKKEIVEYKSRATREEDPLRKQTFEQAVTYCEIESDLLRMELGLAPEHDVTKDLIRKEAREEPLTWRDKVMDVLRKMLAVGTVLSILGGGVSLVFSALSYFHQGTKQAAHAVGEVANSVNRMVKKAGPMLVPVLAATGAVVAVTATALSFVAENITWLAPLFIILFAIWLALRRRRN